MTRERPILFSGPMVRALLAGAKTQTRRVVKPRVACPFAVGQYLWVRETFALGGTEHDDDSPPDLRPTDDNGFWCWYRATEPDPGEDDDGRPVTWRPSIYMPRWASRITLEVTEVRVQRLHDISEEDAQAEGILEWTSAAQTSNPRVRFHELWDSINGKMSPWKGNPWVRAITFRLVKP